MNTRKKCLYLLMALFTSIPLMAQMPLSIDSCRTLALQNNKELLIHQQKMNAANFRRKSARGNYLPQLSVKAGYFHNEKELSILSEDQKNKINNAGTAISSQLAGLSGVIGAVNPSAGKLISGMIPVIQNQVNGMGQEVTNALRTDTRDVFGGLVSLTQPIYMGGKIYAYNQITHYAEEIAKKQNNQEVQQIILTTDQLYWQVISLVNKQKMVESYLKLLTTINKNVDKMILEGVATKADGLTVKVKVNEAEMNLAKINNGLSLVRMALCQNCGLPLDSKITLMDENIEFIQAQPTLYNINMADVYANRAETQSLEYATKIYKEKKRLVQSEYLPHVVAMGNYFISNPSMFDGFQTEFDGTWNVGVMVSMDVFHWGEGYYKTREARAHYNIAQLQLEEAKEKIHLQVSQAQFKLNEAQHKLTMSQKNLEKAEENVRYAKRGFDEGLIPTSDVLAAHTAWLQAKSDLIDSQIDIKMTDIYLQKTLGILK